METLQMKLPLGYQAIRTTPSAAARRQKIKLDPLRALEPARKKLTSIESQRVMCVLEDTKKKCDLVAALPHIMKNLEKFCSLTGQDVAECLGNHKKIYDRFVTLEQKVTELNLQNSKDNLKTEENTEKAPSPPDSRPPSRSLSSRGSGRFRMPDSSAPVSLNEQLESLSSQIKLVELELQISIKNLMRVLNMNPGVDNLILSEVGTSKSREGMFFLTQLNELKDILMEKLLMTPLEEKEKMRYLSQVLVMNFH